MERLVSTFSGRFSVPNSVENGGDDEECLAGHIQDLDLSGISGSGQLVEVDLQGDWEPMSVGPGFASNQPVIHQSRQGTVAVGRAVALCPQVPASCSTALLVLAGQAMAVLLMAIGATNQWLSDSGFHAPKLQSCICFTAIAGVWLPVVALRGELRPLGQGWRWAKLAGLGVVEAQANSLAVTAYQYTSLVSVQLLDNLTIPFVMVLSYLVVKVRYRWGHYAGAAVCLSGVLMLIIYDSCTGTSTEALTDHSILGDLCMVGATCLYAISNVAQESLLKGTSTTPGQWLLGVGLSAALTSGLQSLVVESSALRTLPWGGQVPLYLAAVMVLQLGFYSFTPYMMRHTSASFFNLSLLASDCYSAIAGSVFFSLRFSPLYLVSLVLAAGGAGIYSLVPEAKWPRENCGSREGSKLLPEAPEGRLLADIELSRMDEGSEWCPHGTGEQQDSPPALEDTRPAEQLSSIAE